MGNKVQKLEEEINLMKEELDVIQVTKASWAIETDTKLVNLEDRFWRNNLRFEEKRSIKVNHGRIAKTKFKIYWKTKLK